MFKTLLLASVLCASLNVCYTSLVPFVRKCYLKDNACVLAANLQIAYPYLADGIPEYGVSALEPLQLENISMNHDYFKLTLPTASVFGVKKCRIEQFRVNDEESSLTIVLDCPVLVEGKYKFVGKVCIFNVDKEGDFKVQSDSTKTTINSKFELVEKDGKKYFKLLDYDYSVEPTRSLHIQLGDLFSGDVGKAIPYLNAFDKNLSEAVLPVGKPLYSTIVKSVYGALQQFFLNVPLDELQYA
ncbi:circadian clock-controlled protein daywake-like [Battus philenor]|uniref:circadian clock-controlled protein daywake-like n=1 Tax=Battus philenor TaxID=42288 RepID=UPI0035CFAD89